MNEHEKYEQVGRAAEEYARLKGELSRVTEKLLRLQKDYQLLGQMLGSVYAEDGKLVLPPQYGGTRSLDHIPGASQLAGIVAEKDRIARELGEARARLSALAPHLLE